MGNTLLFPPVFIGMIATIFWLLRCMLHEPIVYFYSRISCFFLYSIISFFCYTRIKKWFAQQRVSPMNKAVLITGCDTGFGYELTKKLDLDGYHVFAGCLFPHGEGANVLKEVCSPRLRVLGIDVTKEESVTNALNYVTKHLGEHDFWAVVNNAGVFQGFEVGWEKMECFEHCIAVNTAGPVLVTKTFLPLLRKCRGRVVTVASLAGHISSPYSTPYTMSKFAAVGLSESLRLETKQFGIKTISVEPEHFTTPMGETIGKRLNDICLDANKGTSEMYGKDHIIGLQQYFVKLRNMSSRNVGIVVQTLYDAVSLQDPDDVYQPCRNFVMNLIVFISIGLPTKFISWFFSFTCSSITM